METEKKTILPRHTTDVDTTSAWDAGEARRRVTSPADREYFSRIFAYLNTGADDTVKSSYRFIHHNVAADGTPGDANFRALAASVAVLNGGRAGTTLNDADRQGVYSHIAKHYQDADREAPMLLKEEEMKSIFDSLETKSDAVSIGSQVSYETEDESATGTVLDIKDGVATMRIWEDNDGFWLPTDETIEISADELSQKHFLADNETEEKADVAELSDNRVVSWETSDGEYYGDILTVQMQGMLRGEPQGMELEGSEDNPIALVRVWMWSDDEWIPTNVTVVAPISVLTAQDSLPNMMENETEDEEEDMPASEDSGMKSDNLVDIKTEGTEMTEQDFEILVKSITRLVISEMGAKIDPPAGFSNKPADNDDPSLVDAAESTEVAAEQPAQEVVAESTEGEAEVAQETVEESPVAEEVAAEEEAPAEPAEQKSALTIDDLKEFNDLVKML